MQNGFELIHDFLSIKQLSPIHSEIRSYDHSLVKGGIRNAEKKFPSIGKLVCSDYIVEKAANYLSGKPQFVRAILFDKTPLNNWLVSWHQDKTVSISGRFNDKAWGPWSVKDGVQHVQPPIDVLNQMVTIRIHLDASTIENGCLKVLPRSHLMGILSQTEIVTHARMVNEVTYCEANAGSAFIMRPHLVHSSSKASQPSRRRVLHLEFSSYSLPEGFFWA